MDVDCIVVFDGGIMVGVGMYEELFEMSDIY